VVGVHVNIFYLNKDDSVHFAAPKKTFKKAVERNRAKRRLRAAIQLVGWPLGYSGVIFAKKSVLDAEFSVIVDEIKKMTAGLRT
jgi:ribonuclease P protein component